MLEKQLLKTEFLGKQVLRWRLICINFIRVLSGSTSGKGRERKAKREEEREKKERERNRIGSCDCRGWQVRNL